MIEWFIIGFMLGVGVGGLIELNHAIKERKEIHVHYKEGCKIDAMLQQAYKDQLQNYKDHTLHLNQQLIRYKDYTDNLNNKIKLLEDKLNETI